MLGLICACASEEIDVLAPLLATVLKESDGLLTQFCAFTTLTSLRWTGLCLGLKTLKAFVMESWIMTELLLPHGSAGFCRWQRFTDRSRPFPAGTRRFLFLLFSLDLDTCVGSVGIASPAIISCKRQDLVVMARYGPLKTYVVCLRGSQACRKTKNYLSDTHDRNTRSDPFTDCHTCYGPHCSSISIAGVFVSRWLFFAQAEHVVGLYYGMRFCYHYKRIALPKVKVVTMFGSLQDVRNM